MTSTPETNLGKVLEDCVVGVSVDDGAVNVLVVGALDSSLHSALQLLLYLHLSAIQITASHRDQSSTENPLLQDTVL
jgi:hypothetical protein